jgi:hypothetical protein
MNAAKLCKLSYNKKRLATCMSFEWATSKKDMKHFKYPFNNSLRQLKKKFKKKFKDTNLNNLIGYVYFSWHL